MSDVQLKNDLLIRVAKGQSVPRPPVWLMRQAGRFLSEYRAVRARAGSFREMIACPEYAAEVTLQPVDLIGVDAAIIFSDILVIPEAMGLPYDMIPGKGPLFPETVRDLKDLNRLHAPEEESNLDHTYEAIRMVKNELAGRVPLIGFAGAPWTIFCYMTEGSGSKTFSHAKSLLYRAPEFSHRLLQMITDATLTYLQGQIAAGVNIVQLFDSWAGVLNREMYERFALSYLRQICEGIQKVPKIVFAKGAFYSLDQIGTLDCQVVGLDWQTSADFAQARIQGKAFQGNLDPCALYGAPADIKIAARRMVEAFPPEKLIANLGHGIYPDLPRDHVKTFVETVQSYEYTAQT